MERTIRQLSVRIAVLSAMIGLLVLAMLVHPLYMQAAFLFAIDTKIPTLRVPATPLTRATSTPSPSPTTTVTSVPTSTPTSSAPHIQSGSPVRQNGTSDLIVADVRLDANRTAYGNCDFTDETVLMVVIANYRQADARSPITLNVHPIGVQLKTTIPTASWGSLAAGQSREIRLPTYLIGGDGVEMEISYQGAESSKANNQLIVTWKQLLLSYTPVPRCTPTYTHTRTLTPSITLTPSFGPSPTRSDTATSTPT